MTTVVQVPLSADAVEKLRKFIDHRFRDVSGIKFDTMRRVAHCALDELLKGNVEGAKLGIQRLGPEAERDFLAKLRQLGIALE